MPGHAHGGFRQPRPVRAEVQIQDHPLPAFVSHSSSTSYDTQIAYVSSSLWAKLMSTSNSGVADGVTQEGKLGVAIEWPEDRRLGKGKERGLVVWVEQQKAVGKATNGRRPDEGDTIYLQPDLLPSFSATPLSVLIHMHVPFQLSLVILQPAIGGTTATPPATNDTEADDLDLSSLYHQEDRSANGSNSTAKMSSIPYPILRQGEIISIPHLASTPLPLSPSHKDTAEAEGRYRLLLLEPVSQGVMTPSTRVILSTTPYFLDPAQGGYPEMNREGSESSYSKTHLSLSGFDADAFLSSSLSLSLSRATSYPDGEVFSDSDIGLSQSLSLSQSSSTSGSLTPRPGGVNGRLPSPPAVLADLSPDEPERGAKFTPVRASGPAKQRNYGKEEVCWLGVAGLGRAGIFEGDWLLVRRAGVHQEGSGRLVKALAWEKLDEPEEDLPSDPILLTPSLYRSLFPNPPSAGSVLIQPTPFGARAPTIPTARTITLARIATAEGTDKRYERAWLKGLRNHFTYQKTSSSIDGEGRQLVRTGDIISIPIWESKPVVSAEGIEQDSEEDSDEEDSFSHSEWCRSNSFKPTGLAYFSITSLSYDSLVPLEEDFRSSISSKARAGELGCWADVGEVRITKMVLTGVEKARVGERASDQSWHSIGLIPTPFNTRAAAKIRDLLESSFASASLAYVIQLSILVKGARGSGKRSLIGSIADELGYNVVNVECYDIIGDTPAVTAGTLLARLDKAKTCSPSLLVLHHVEALAKKTESTVLGRPPPVVKVIEEVMQAAMGAAADGWPVIVVGTTVDGDAVPNELAGCFKQEVEIGAPNEIERLSIVQQALDNVSVAPDVDLTQVARQTAALHAGDIVALLHRAQDLSLKRISSLSQSFGSERQYQWSTRSAQLAGLSLTSADLNHAITDARSSYSDSIGAPKIPNVSWDDVGGLVSVKQDILDTIQLPLERPEMFGEGLKKRSGILLYGPPGTGKTLLAKAVATSCSLNFLSVKGPELLNMYIGESEANVRRLFQRARDASPCVIFMDELDSLAPKRGNQGDSGGVMDRIVSQLLAELDGMSSGSSSTAAGGDSGGGGQVFVLGATNRPDLLDSALLRPGRFDKMLYLSVPTTHESQLSILEALTRKFNLDPELDLADVARQCQFNYTGADLYALCSDAMLSAMTRAATSIDEKIALLNQEHNHDQAQAVAEGEGEIDVRSSATAKFGSGLDIARTWKGELTPQYYLAKLATKEEMEVRVTQTDFELALGKLVPSVSVEEMRHYESVQKEFKGFEIGNGNGNGNGSGNEPEQSVGSSTNTVNVNGDGGYGESEQLESHASHGDGNRNVDGQSDRGAPRTRAGDPMEADGEIMNASIGDRKGKGKAKMSYDEHDSHIGLNGDRHHSGELNEES